MTSTIHPASADPETMPGTPNAISTKQNDHASLRLLAAQRQLYGSAKAWSVWQALLVLTVPAAVLIVSANIPDVRPWGALAGICVALTDLLFIEPAIRRLRGRAACVQEWFDTEVLSIPWNRWLIGERPDLEDIQGAERQLASRKGGLAAQKLEDWYPTAVAEVPLSFARIICQRANTRWDSDLRRRYANGISISVLLVVVAIVAVGLAMNMSLEDVLLVVLTPALPALMWAARERVRHMHAADSGEKLKSLGTELWDSAIRGECPDDQCAIQSRQFQDALYQHRKTSPFVFDWIYWLGRGRAEKRMQASAEEMVRQAKARV